MAAGGRTFIFCTTYFDRCHPSGSPARYQKWLDFYRPRLEAFGAQRLFMVDDGSRADEIRIPVQVFAAEERRDCEPPEEVQLYRFSTHLGRLSKGTFPGWWRSFTFAGQLARAYGYQRVIHLESDAFVLSRRLADFIAKAEDGWTVLWCPRWRMPETSAQIIAGSSVPVLAELYDRGPDFFAMSRDARTIPEASLPFTRIEQGFMGDRYGEYTSAYPPNADFTAQTSLETDLAAGY
jgi:hypothetical protein